MFSIPLLLLPFSFPIPQALGYTGRNSNCQKNCSSFPEGFSLATEACLTNTGHVESPGGWSPIQSKLQGILDGDQWINTSPLSAFTWEGPEAQWLLVPWASQQDFKLLWFTCLSCLTVYPLLTSSPSRCYFPTCVLVVLSIVSQIRAFESLT